MGDQSVLRKIFGAAKLSRMERSARANRTRELLLSLKSAALAMEERDRVAFAELLELARAEHRAAVQEAQDALEVESVSMLIQKLCLDLENLRVANAKMKAVAERLQAKESQTLWGLIVGRIRRTKNKEQMCQFSQ